MLVNVTEFKPGAGWEQARIDTMKGANSACLDLCKENVKKVFTRWIEIMRAGGFNGRVVFRTTQTNLGFNARGHGNCITLHLNACVRESARDGTFHKLKIEVLDIEALTGTRPETFVHQNTNHFFCECMAGGDRYRCPTQACLQKRTDRYQNGEPNRLLAKMVLNVVGDTPFEWVPFRRKSAFQPTPRN
jgi:hypothetical protein